jgi:hypothetical protein
MMPWFMGMGARLFSWEHEGIIDTFMKVRCKIARRFSSPSNLQLLPCLCLRRCLQGVKEQPMAAIMQFKSFMLAGLVAWLLQMIVFAPAFYYSSKFAAQRLFVTKERKLSV